LDSGSRRRFLANDPKLLPQGVLFGRQRQVNIQLRKPVMKFQGCSAGFGTGLRDTEESLKSKSGSREVDLCPALAAMLNRAPLGSLLLFETQGP
jgi:hypothetical protein